MSCPWMRTDPESGFSKPMMSLSNTLLPVPLRPNTARVSPRVTVRLIPFNTVWLPKVLCKPSTATADDVAVSLGFLYLLRNLIDRMHTCSRVSDPAMGKI